MRMERLENRSLMAGNVSVQVEGNTLNIRGDGGDNTVTIFRDNFHNNNSIFVSGTSTGNTTKINGGTDWLLVPLSRFQNIKVNLGAGSDAFSLTENIKLASVDVIMGQGILDTVKIASTNRINEIRVDATDTHKANVTVGGNAGTVTVATGAGKDDVTLKGSITSASIKTGASDDKLILDNTQIQNLRAEMGRGADRVFMYDSSIESGVINGGAGRDQTVRGLRRVSKNFEVVS